MMLIEQINKVCPFLGLNFYFYKNGLMLCVGSTNYVKNIIHFSFNISKNNLFFYQVQLPDLELQWDGFS